MSHSVLPNASESESDTNKANDNADQDILVTVLMPCLNEARTVGPCIDQAHAGCQAALAARAGRSDADGGNELLGYEILIADNGSEDNSAEIAIGHGARVVHVSELGYGAALRGGIAAARGKYVVMGDADCSYDFGEVPRFLDKLEEGYDLVIGNRFAGGIMPGAMPWHHRYIGNPLLSGLGNLLYRTPCKDWHCGLRAFDREMISELNLKASGMEFASELVLRVARNDLEACEVPIKLFPDGRSRPPHLRCLSDGCRHLWVLFAGVFARNSFCSVLNAAQWLVVAFILSLSAFGYFWSSVEREEDLVNGRLSPPTVHVKPGKTDRKMHKGILTLLNQFDGEITNLEVHVGCKCTVLDNVPKSIREGQEVSINVRVEDTTPAGQVIIVEYELSRRGDVIPVSELVTTVTEFESSSF